MSSQILFRMALDNGSIDMMTDGKEEREFYTQKIVVKHLKQ